MQHYYYESTCSIVNNLKLLLLVCRLSTTSQISWQSWTNHGVWLSGENEHWRRNWSNL